MKVYLRMFCFIFRASSKVMKSRCRKVEEEKSLSPTNYPASRVDPPQTYAPSTTVNWAEKPVMRGARLSCRLERVQRAIYVAVNTAINVNVVSLAYVLIAR